MNSFIVINDFITWLIVLYLIFQFIVLCMLGCGYLRGQKELYKKDRTIKRLRADNNKLMGMYIKDCSTEGQVNRDG